MACKFCVSTEAYRRLIGEAPSINGLLEGLSLLKVADREKIGEVSREIRRAIEGMAIPPDIGEEISRALQGLGQHTPLRAGARSGSPTGPLVSL
jgi:pyruvate,water dikinase